MKNREIRFKPLLSCLVLVMGAFAAACGSGGDGNSAPGVVAVSLTDAPACGFDAVTVTVSKVRIHQSDSASDNTAGWTDITLSPPTDDETVFVAAKQTFSSGPTVTVKSQPAMLIAGDPPGDFSYTQTLATGAPLLGSYSTTLPIIFTAQPALAGQYAVQASASGYAPQSFNKDISTVDQILNFTLTP